MRTGSPIAAVQHGLVVLAIIWQGLFLIAEISAGRGGSSANWYQATITVTWLGVVVTTWGPGARRPGQSVARVVNICALLGWSVLFIVVLPSDGGWQDGASIINIAVGLVGFLAPSRAAFVLIPLIAVIEVGLLQFGTRELLVRPPLASEALYGLYALTVGFTAMFARLALLRAAGRAEISQESLVRERIQAQAMQEASAQLEEDERRIHATVLNTLTAFGRGMIADPDLIRQRAEESLRVLREFIPREAPVTTVHTDAWQEVMFRHVEDARRTGLHMTFIERLRHVPPQFVGDAFAHVLGEALSNVARHAAATRVTVEFVERRWRGYELVVRDDGIGMEPGVKPGFGIRQGMQRVMQQIGGTLSFTQAQPNGVEVRAYWRADGRRPDADSAVTTQAILASFASPVLVLMWVFTTLRLAWSWDEYLDLAPVILAYVWYTLIASAMLVITRRRSLGTLATVAIVIAAPMIYVLQSLGGVVPDGTPWASWSSEAIVSLFLVLIGAGPWWTALPVLGMWLVMQGDVVAELFAPGFVILVATTFFARSIRRSAAMLAASDLERVAIEAGAIAANARLEQLVQRYGITSVGNAIGLVKGIARGELDVAEPQVQAQCLREERLLRSVLRLDPARSQLDRLVGDIAQRAYALELNVHVDTQSLPVDVDADALGAFAAQVNATLDVMAADHEARLRIAQDTDRYVARFVATCALPPDTVVDTHPTVELIDVGECTWMVQWEVGDAARHRR